MARIGRESLKTRHKQVFDIYDINGGFPLGFVNNFLTPNQSATAVLIFRHQGLPYALNSAMWAKYKVGETFKIIDPETKAPAVKNPWFEPKPGVLANPEVALDRLIAKGAVMGVCGVALRGQSRRLAANAGVSPDDAFKEFAANLLPGRHRRSFGDLGGEPGAGGRLHLLLGRRLRFGLALTCATGRQCGMFASGAWV